VRKKKCGKKRERERERERERKGHKDKKELKGHFEKKEKKEKEELGILDYKLRLNFLLPSWRASYSKKL